MERRRQDLWVMLERVNWLMDCGHEVEAGVHTHPFAHPVTGWSKILLVLTVIALSSLLLALFTYSIFIQEKHIVWFLKKSNSTSRKVDPFASLLSNLADPRFSFLCIFLKLWESRGWGGEERRENSHLLIYSPNALGHGWCWALPRWGTSTPSGSSHMGCKDPLLEPSLAGWLTAA